MTLVAVAFVASCIAFCIAGYFYFFPSNGGKDLSQKSTDFFETTPARQLVPRIQSLMKPGHKLIVTSSSGRYPESLAGGSLWIEKIHEWLESGVAIEYLVTSGKPKHCAAISELGLKFPSLMEISYLTKAEDISELMLEIIDDYQDTHPTFLVDSDRSPVALWLERFHAPESGMALEVSYISPKDISESELADRHWKRLSELLKVSETLSQSEMTQICLVTAEAA